MSDNPYHAPQSRQPPAGVGGINMDDHEPAPVYRRGLAFAVDYMAISVAASPLTMLWIQYRAELDPQFLLFRLGFIGVLGVAGLLMGALEASGWHGTPGKKLLGLLVVRGDGQHLTLMQALTRNLIKWLGGSVCGVLFFTPLLGWSAWDAAIDGRVVQKKRA